MSLTRRDVLHYGACGAALCGLGGLGACSANRATGDSSFTGLMSIEDDIAMGREQHPKLVKEFGGEYDNPRLASYIDRLGRRGAEHAEYQEFPYTFTIVNSPIVNAFALPGGFVYVSRGLVAFASSEAELMGVICHEIGHVNARHTAERLSSAQLAQGLLLLGTVATGSGAVADVGGSIAGVALQSFSREQEFEADTLGIRYMTRAGYDPDAMAGFLSTLRSYSRVQARIAGRNPDSVDETNIMATHPRTIERVERAKQQAVETGGRGDVARVNRDQYLGQVDGMLYGDDPKQGIIDGRTFKHPDLRFAFTVPQDFTILNSPERVTAFNQARSAHIVFDMAKTAPGTAMTAYLQREWARNANLSDVESIDVNGMPAATGRTRMRGRDGAMDVRAVAIRGEGKQVYRFLFLTDPGATDRFNTALRETTYSFRRLSKEEAGRIHAHRLLVVRAQPGDSVEALAGPMPHGRYNAAMFRVLNDLKDGQGLPSGELIKTVAS